MGEPVRIQRKRTKGWKMPPNTVYVGRPTKWGNPYVIDEARECGYEGSDAEIAEFCARLFRSAVFNRGTGRYVETVPTLDEIQELCGKNLACWCPLDQPCHADVLLELANTTPGDRNSE